LLFSIVVKQTSHFSPRIQFKHSISRNIGMISVACKVNLIFKIKNLVFSVTVLFVHQVFRLSKHSTEFFWLKKGAYHFFSM